MAIPSDPQPSEPRKTKDEKRLIVTNMRLSLAGIHRLSAAQREQRIDQTELIDKSFIPEPTIQGTAPQTLSSVMIRQLPAYVPFQPLEALERMADTGNVEIIRLSPYYLIKHLHKFHLFQMPGFREQLSQRPGYLEH
jgi:hypothetical protein